MRQRLGPTAAVIALVALTICGCGSSHGPASGAAGQAHAAPTTQAQQTTTRARQTTTQAQRTTTQARQQPAHKRHTRKRLTRSAKKGSATTQLRPLAQLAAACRSAPPLGAEPSGGGKAATRELVAMLSMRVRFLTNALGPRLSRARAAPILAPLLHALTGLKKAVRRASKSPRRGAAQALRHAAAQLSAAAQQIGVPECALAGR